MDCTGNEINVLELISLRFNMHIGAGRGGSMGGHAGYTIVGHLVWGYLCNCGTVGILYLV